MDLNNTLTFGGINSATYGIYIDGSGVFNSPERDVTMVTIPSRNGQLSLDNGRFENIEVTYNAFVTENNGKTMAENIRDFRNAIGSLKGYQRLEDTYHTDEFRMGVFRNGIEVEPVIYQTGGAFEVTFDCKPQRWILPEAKYSNGQATPPNITPFIMHPIIDVYYLKSNQGQTMTGEFKFMSLDIAAPFIVDIDLSVLTQNITGAQGVLHIDCELIEAYQYTDYNHNTQTESGTVKSINSAVTFTNGIPEVYPSGYQDSYALNNLSSVVVKPHYWRI